MKLLKIITFLFSAFLIYRFYNNNYSEKISAERFSTFSATGIAPAARPNFGRELSYGYPYYWKYLNCGLKHYDDYDYKRCDAHSGNVMYINDWIGSDKTKSKNCKPYGPCCSHSF